jgi:hypothetical protein
VHIEIREEGNPGNVRKVHNYTFKPFSLWQQGNLQMRRFALMGYRELINQIYVTNLPLATKEGDIRELFAVYGEVLSIRVSTESERNGGRVFGFVRMRHADARAAMDALDGVEFGGQTLKLM